MRFNESARRVACASSASSAPSVIVCCAGRPTALALLLRCKSPPLTMAAELDYIYLCANVCAQRAVLAEIWVSSSRSSEDARRPHNMFFCVCLRRRRRCVVRCKCVALCSIDATTDLFYSLAFTHSLISTSASATRSVVACARTQASYYQPTRGTRTAQHSSLLYGRGYAVFYCACVRARAFGPRAKWGKFFMPLRLATGAHKQYASQRRCCTA